MKYLTIEYNNPKEFKEGLKILTKELQKIRHDDAKIEVPPSLFDSRDGYCLYALTDFYGIHAHHYENFKMAANRKEKKRGFTYRELKLHKIIPLSKYLIQD